MGTQRNKIEAAVELLFSAAKVTEEITEQLVQASTLVTEAQNVLDKEQTNGIAIKTEGLISKADMLLSIANSGLATGAASLELIRSAMKDLIKARTYTE